jgi:hypothetical protein
MQKLILVSHYQMVILGGTSVHNAQIRTIVFRLLESSEHIILKFLEAFCHRMASTKA